MAKCDESDVQRRRACCAAFLVYLCTAVDSMDGHMHPAIMRQLEVDFGLSPKSLGILSLIQGLSAALARPVWGIISDVYNRKGVLIFAAIGWGISTALIGFTNGFLFLAFSRALNGLCLASMAPLSQSIIADLYPPGKRGAAYGIMSAFKAGGGFIGMVYAGALTAQRFTLGKNATFSGWRVPFWSLGGLSATLAVLLLCFFHDPPRGAHDDESDESATLQKHYAPAQDEGDPDSCQQHCTRFRELFEKLFQFGGLRSKSVWLIILQGIFGATPWHTFAFLVLLLQYTGFSSFQASLIYGFFTLSGGVGAMLGGFVADQLVRIWGPRGRVLAAQISVAAGIPVLALFLFALPRQTNAGVDGMPISFVALYCLVASIFGLVATWPQAGTNRPIFSEVTFPLLRGTVFAVEMCIEGGFGALGGPLVGFLSEKAFGYQPSTKLTAQIPSEQRRHNANALRTAIIVTAAVCWTVCLALYSLLYCTYPAEAAKVHALRRQSASKVETEKIPLLDDKTE